jgi:peptidyl-prolyl cis-trans isomerase D
MLESIRRGQRWLTLLLVTFVGGVFVFFMGVGGQFGPGRPTGNAVVELGDMRMSVADFQRVRARQEELYREQLGEQFDARATAAFLDSQSLRQLVDGVVMAESARSLGIRVSREEVQDLVRQSPAFRDEAGRFVPEAFVEFANYEYGSQRAFLEIVRTDLLRQKMVALLYDQATVSPAEVREAALYGLEQVRIAYVALDTTSTPAGDAPDEEAVAGYLEANRPALLELYEARQEEFVLPERAQAHHILVRVGPDADEETVAEARARAEAARARVVAGEPFEDVARAVSEDPGSREQGGDLGEFGRGTHAQALEDAAFGLQPGDLSEIVRTGSGFHIVRLDAIEPARTRPFDDDVGPELAREEMVRKRAEERARQLSMQLADAIRSGRSLEDAARELELTLERTPLFTRRPDGFVPGLGGAPDVMATAFGLDLDAPSSPTVHPVGPRLVLVQLLERQAPSNEELAAAEAQIAPSLLDAKRNQLVQDWIDRRREDLEASGDLLVNASLVISGA